MGMGKTLFEQSNLILLLTAFIGTVGFSIVFRTRARYLLPGGIIGLLAEAVYILSDAGGLSPFVSAFFSALFVSLTAEVMARVFKTPSTMFLLPGIIPIVPGSSLYYAMSALIFKDMTEFRSCGVTALLISLGVASGIIVVAVLVNLWNAIVMAKRNLQRKM